MASPAREEEEPLTPTGRLFVRPELSQEIFFTLGLAMPLDVEATKSAIILHSFFHHPRFRSLVLRHPSGLERLQTTDLDLRRHLIVVDRRVSSSVDDSDAVNDYIADVASGPGLSFDKPLWEIHFLTAHRCIVFRVHHALVDGISLMSMVMSACRRVRDPSAVPEIPPPARSYGWDKEKGKSVMERVMRFLGMVWFSLVFVLGILMRLIWVRDPHTAIRSGDGVELWRRKLVTARFLLEDMELVKRAVAKATINDVLVGVVSYGMAKYINHRTPNALQKRLQITGMSMVNLRKQPGLPELSDLTRSNAKSQWGNKFGFILLPIHYEKNDHINSNPLQFVQKMKVLLDRKKQSIEAHLPYKISSVASYLGSKYVGFCLHRIICNTSFRISNIVGPPEEITIGDNLVTYMRVNTTSLSHALSMNLLSYAGMAELQILVAKDIIPDPEFLAKCFENALHEMKEDATR